MRNKKQHQGKFHLATIFLIPGFIVTVFLSESWLYSILYCLISKSKLAQHKLFD